MKRKTTMRRANRRTLLDRMPARQVSAIITIVMVVATILDMLNALFWGNGIVRVLAGTIYAGALAAKVFLAARSGRPSQRLAPLWQAWKVLPNSYRGGLAVLILFVVTFELTLLTVTRLFKSSLLLVSLVLVDLWLASRILFFLADNAPEGTDDDDEDENEDDEDEDNDNDDDRDTLSLKKLATRQARNGDWSFLEIENDEVLISIFKGNSALLKLAKQRVSNEGWGWLKPLPKKVLEMLLTTGPAEPDESEDSEGAAEHGDGSTNTKSIPWKQVCYLLAIIWSVVVALALAGKFRPLAIGNLVQIAIPLLCGMFGKHVNAFRPQKIIWGAITMGIAGDSIPGFLITLVLWILVVKGSKEELSWEEGENGMIASFTPIGFTGIPVPWRTIRFYRSPNGYLEANEIYHLPFLLTAVLSSSVDDLYQLEDPEYHSSFWEVTFLGSARVRCVRMKDKEHPLVFRIPVSLAKQATYSGGKLKRLRWEDMENHGVVIHQH